MDAKTINNSAESIKEEVVGFRRKLHSVAETGFDLTNTVSFVKETLDRIGVKAEFCGKNGLVAAIGKGGGKTFLLRADMDALPIKENTDLPFAASNGNMHACGHDMHTAMLLGAAIILKENEKLINGTVKLMFQPAEEILSGAKSMIENGVLKNPDVSVAMMLHVMAGLPIPAGTVIVSSGGVSAPAADYFTVNIKGKSSHGSTPQDGIDSVLIGAYIITALQVIPSRELGIADEAVITIGRFNGGTAGNVTAESAVIEGTMRCFNEDLREKIKKRIIEISENIAKTFRGKADVAFDRGCPPLVNDEELSQSILKYTKEIFGDEKVLSSKDVNRSSSKAGGSEDFSYISQEVPSVMLALAAGGPAEGFNNPLHHPQVDFDEDILTVGSAIFSYNAIKWLENN